LDQFWVIRDGAQSGPFSEAEVLRAYHDGTLLSTDMLWAEGVDAPVTIAEAFAHLNTGATSDARLSLEPIEATRTRALSREPIDPIDPVRRSARAESSPYRAPTAVLDDERGGAGGGQPRYAGFWVRYSASMLDSLILGLIMVVITFIIATLVAMAGIDLSESEWAGAAISLPLTWLYLALGESSAACATWGKRAFHLQVVEAENLDRISFLRATGRFLGRYLSIALLMIGYLMQPFNARKRALHDFLAGTVVVVERDYSRLLMVPMILLGLLVPVGIVAAIALPAYQGYVAQQKVSEALRQVAPATPAVERYLTRSGQVPGSLEEAGFDTRRTLAGIRQLAFAADTGIITVTLGIEPVSGDTLLIVPAVIDNGRIVWGCRPGTLPPGFLPRHCPPGDGR